MSSTATPVADRVSGLVADMATHQIAAQLGILTAPAAGAQQAQAAMGLDLTASTPMAPAPCPCRPPSSSTPAA